MCWCYRVHGNCDKSQGNGEKLLARMVNDQVSHLHSVCIEDTFLGTLAVQGEREEGGGNATLQV